MELKVIGKRLFTERIDKAITEGEYNADIIGITLDRYHDGIDLSEYSFRVTAYSENNEAIAEQVLAKDPAGEKTIRLVWTVTPMFTSESGIFSLTLAGVAPDNSAQIKFTSAPVKINADGRAEFIPEKTVAEQYLNQVQLEVQKALDAAVRAENAASQTFEVPVADEEEVGGILSGGDISVSENGTVTVNSIGGKTLEASVPADAKFTDTVYTLPKATANELGGVKVDGTTVTVDENGTISSVAGAGEKYILPKATASVLGGVKVDGTTITANADGVISAIKSSEGSGSGNSGDYILPPATESSLGGVIVDGTTITVSGSGVISANITGGGSSPTGIEADGTTIIESGGVISVADNSHAHTIANVTGLQNALNGKADISAIPSSLPANGGNADTVGGFTVEANVPAGAKFTDTVYTLPEASSSVSGGVKVDGTTILSNSGVISVAENSHSHTIANVTGLQTALDGKADISAIPSSLPANGGNADTVGGFTVGTNVPSNAKFTDTVYTLPQASAAVLGGVKVDGSTISINSSGIISALSSGGTGITIDKIFEKNGYWTNLESEKRGYIKLPYPVTTWDYLLVSGIYAPLNTPVFGYCGTHLIKTAYIIYQSRDKATGAATGGYQQHIIGMSEINTNYISFFNPTHIYYHNFDKITLWGIKVPSVVSQTMLGTIVANANA